MAVKAWLTRGLTAVLTALCLMAGVVIFADSPAMAACAEWGECTLADPKETGCADDGITVSSTELTDVSGSIGGAVSFGFGGEIVGSLDLRWSETCKTNWVRLTTTRHLNIRHLVIEQRDGVQSRVELLSPGSPYKTLEPGVYWTPMVYSPDKACHGYIYWPAHGMNWWPETAWV